MHIVSGRSLGCSRPMETVDCLLQQSSEQTAKGEQLLPGSSNKTTAHHVGTATGLQQ